MDVSTCLKSAMMLSSKCWQKSDSESATGTLVNSDTTSKLNIRSSGFTCKDYTILVNWKEFFT